MTIYYIPSAERMINDAHIIHAKFKPAHTYRNTDDLGPEATVEFATASLVLTTTELVLDEDSDAGNTASRSQTIYLRGLEAEYLWEAMKRSAYALGVLPSEEEKIAMGVDKGA